MARVRLSALDAAFLTLESPRAPMHLGWAARFAAPVDSPRPRFEEMRAQIAGRLDRAPRYRQKLVDVPLGLGDPVWVDDPAFDIERHVRRAGHGNFGRLVDEVMSSPLEHDRPLWELWFAEHLDDGQVGVVGKAHHCLVDGLAAVEFMTLLLDTSPQAERDAPRDWMPSRPRALGLVAEAVGHQLGQAQDLVRLPLGWSRHPSGLLALPGVAWRAGRAVAHMAEPLAPPSPLNAALSSSMRHLAWRSRPFQDLRTIKRRFGTTVNDVLLSASAEALRGLLAERDAPARRLKAMVPVSVEDPDERWGNHLTFLFVELPCEENDPAGRLREVHLAMRRRKRGGEPEGMAAVLAALAYAPRAVRRVAARVLASPQLSNLTISNIPGPRVPLYLMGCRLTDAYPVVPLIDGHGISIGMTTICDRACFGVYGQAELSLDAERLARGIDDDIDELLARCSPERADSQA